MRSELLRGLAAALALLAGLPAAAQGSLLDQGKALLQGQMSGSGSGAGGGKTASTLPTSKVAAGLKEALSVGAGNVVGQLGRTDGFLKDGKAHIPLPDGLRKAQSALKLAGLSGMADDLEVRLNRAAEAATPKAKALFLQAIRDMTLDDAMRIYRGPENAATQYFERQTRQPLAGEMQPTVSSALADAGAVQAFDSLAGRLQGMPLVPDLKTDLTGYVTQRALDAVFFYLGREEAAIRSNPAKRSTDLLRQVFGG